MNFIYFILITFSISAFCAVKHIVIDIDEVIVRQVPQSKKSSYAPSSLIVANGRLFHKMPYVAESFMRLQHQSDVLVHFITDQSLSFAREVLKGFILKEPFKETILSYYTANSANKIISAADLSNGIISLKSITTDTDNIVVISNKKSLLSDIENSHRLSLPKTLYYFKDYEEAKAEIQMFKDKGYLDSHKDHLAADQNEWRNEHFKLPAIIAKFIYDDSLSHSKLLSRVSSLNKLDINKMTDLALKLSDFDFNHIVYRWKLTHNKSKVIGCEKYDYLKKRTIGQYSISDCAKKLSTHLDYELDEKLFTVKNCAVRELEHNAVIHYERIENCIENSDLSYYWQELRGKKECRSFVDSYFYYKNENNEKCNFYEIVFDDGKPEVLISYENINGLNLIEELSNTVKGAIIPYELYEEYSSEDIATSLVLSKHLQHEPKGVKDYKYDFLNDTTITMAFDSKWISAIIRKGYLNQHRSGQSNGALTKSRRATLEDSMIGARLEDSYNSIGQKVHNVRPKYAFLNLTKQTAKTGFNEFLGQYGNVYAVFSKNVKVRSTFTAGDSLNIGAGFDENHTFFYKSDSHIKHTNHYFEAQVWGELTIKNVEYFLINCSHVSNISSEQIKALQATKVPVYDCSTKKKSGGSYPYSVFKKNLIK